MIGTIPQWTRCMVIAALALLGVGFASAQESYPTRVVHLIVPFAPGGATDVSARMIAQALSAHWKQPVVVENRAGASGAIGAAAVARARPDGYTLLIATQGALGSAEVLKPSSTPYRTLRDFAPIAQWGVAQMLMYARADLGIKDAKALVAYAKANPGKLSYASTGIGTANHIAAELFKSAADIDIVHVPYSGAAPAVQAMMGGTIDLLFNASALGLIRASGRGTVLAVMSPERSPDVPEVLTLREQGFPVEYDGWYGLAAPVAVPGPIIAKIEQDVMTALNTDSFREQLAKVFIARKLAPRDVLQKVFRDEIEKTERAIRAARLPIE